MFYIEREFFFDAAHRVVNYTGKCENLHGHTYKLIVSVTGELQANGMVTDFAILKQVVENSVIKELDHKFLNDIFENPTTELIAQWIFDRLTNEFEAFNCKLVEITLFEGHNNRVVVS